MELTVETLRQMLTDILVGNNSGARPPGPGGANAKGGGNGGIIDQLAENAGLLSKKFVDVIGAGIRLETAWKTAGQDIGKEAKGAMEMLAKYGAGPLAAMGNAALAQADKSRANSNEGIGGGDFMGMTVGLRTAGLEVKDYATAMANSKGALNNFAGNADDRARQLAGTGDKLIKSAQDSGLANQIGQAELGKILLLSQMGRKEELATEEAKIGAAKSAKELAEQINRTAISSGKSRDVIEKELEARLSSAEVQAQLVGATEDQRKAIIASQAALAGMGKGAGDAAQIIQAGGRLSQENQIQMMSMGPKAMGEFIKGNQLMAKAKTDQEREAAQAILDRAKVDTAEYQKTKGFQRLLQSAPDQLRGGLRKSYEENLERGGVNATQANRAPGQTKYDTEKERQKEVANLSESKLKTGAPNPQVAPQQAVTQLQNAAFNTANESLALLNKEITKLANSKLGIETWGKAVTAVYGKGGDVEKSMNVILNAGKAVLGVTTPGGGGTGTGTAPNAPAVNTQLPKLQKKAQGGPVDAEQVYIVGENGPELFKSKTAGDIVPNDKFQSMFGDIKTKISGLGGSPLKTDIPKAATPRFDLPKFEMPKVATPRFDMPKFELPKIDRPSANPMAAPKIEAPRFDPSTMSRAEQEQAKKSERDGAVGESISKQSATPTKSAEPMPTAGGTVSMKDLNDSLIRLNSSMDKMLKATLDISGHSEKTAKNSGKATGNRTHA